MAMNRSTHPYKRIGSFVELSNEKIRLSYESRLARRKLDLSLLKLQEELKPARLLGGLASRWLLPLSETIKSHIINFFHRGSQSY